MRVDLWHVVVPCRAEVCVLMKQALRKDGQTCAIVCIYEICVVRQWALVGLEKFSSHVAPIEADDKCDCGHWHQMALTD